MILVAFLRVMPGMTFLRITTTCGIEFSQSLYKMTFQGRSGLTLLPVWVPSALLISVAVISWEPFCRLVPCASSHRLFPSTHFGGNADIVRVPWFCEA